jgi:hypothetical protein
MSTIVQCPASRFPAVGVDEGGTTTCRVCGQDVRVVAFLPRAPDDPFPGLDVPRIEPHTWEIPHARR